MNRSVVPHYLVHGRFIELPIGIHGYLPFEYGQVCFRPVIRQFAVHNKFFFLCTDQTFKRAYLEK